MLNQGVDPVEQKRKNKNSTLLFKEVAAEWYKVAERSGILCTVVEEFWWPTRFEATQEFILKILKTDRKRGGWIVLTSQSPEDAINSPIFAAIVQQTPTKLFLPNPDAKYQGSYELCGMTS
ncbi:hypothetical protein AAEX37_02236 [Oligella sp. MSHR50489EDL]|uniref:hypothetical protein n=1 Tax=Oligella sp. MSHR50489EDL TaxID=3139409 RepID=UPI003D813C94